MQDRKNANSMADIIGGKKDAYENEYIRFDTLSALVIDDIGAMRHALRSQLQWMEMNSIKCVADAQEALGQIENNRYDLILCDYNLNKATSGQHFLEYLRHEHLLSAKTIFVMVTAEAEYAFVANAAEFAPDDYILKPCPEKKLRARLERLFDRRNFLLPALTAMDDKNYLLVVSECDRLMALVTNERWLMAALKLKAEALLALNDTTDLLKTYEQALAMRDNVPWVKIGIARARMLLNEVDAAEEMAKQIVADNPSYVAAYELLAEIRRMQKDEEGAYQLMEQSAKILPTAKRFRSNAESAFLLGKLDEAKKYSESAIRLASGSITERPDDYLSLAQIQTDLGDPQGAIHTLEKSARKFEEKGSFGISKNAILAQAYFDAGDKAAAKRLLERSQRLLTAESSSSAMNSLGKAAFKTGDSVLGLKMLTQAVQSSGLERERIARHVTKSMIDTGQHDKVDEVIDAGQRRVLALVEEARKAMHVAQFDAAYRKVLDALAIQSDNIEALFAAAQLHLLWLKQGGMDADVQERAKSYLAILDKLVPHNEKVMSFYRFYDQLTGA
ncbi:response regulator [Sideroxydans lithotrophicus]|uniref:Response regulator receiver protein n=1 Tax=Sideroxydans lithotrophicus (strain ES-1) TaxID=580332 RepID=D5CR54_SIDLE|nr:response regulator [Sideroxydans lithotrophicus]ADE11440.1 response regulator receiver protein [Sideroxydans lithotrophicus ES-1]